MHDEVIFFSMFGATLVVSICAWVCFGLPYLRSKPVWTELAYLATPLLYQHLAFATLARSVVGAVPVSFGYVVSTCNVVTIPLVAVLCFAIRARSPRAAFWGWVVTAAGVVGGLATVYAAFLYDVFAELRAHWYVATMYVPIQALCHVFMANVLRTRSGEIAKGV